MGFFFRNRNKNIVIPGINEGDGIEFEGEIITLPMTDGTDREFTILDQIEYEGENYMALLSASDVKVTEDGFNFQVTLVRASNIKVGKDGLQNFEVEPVTDKALQQKLMEIFESEVSIETEEIEESEETEKS